MSLAALKQHTDAIEECYEFLLAYAAQGLPGDAGTESGGQLREFLRRAVAALASLPGAYRAAVGGLQPVARYQAFQDVLERDAGDSEAILQLVLAQPALSSQLIDNLNASMHLRALLTDLFLIDEILKAASIAAESAARESQP